MDSTERPELADTHADTNQGRTSAPSLDTASRIGRYFVLEQLGAGGMGFVYAAFDPELDRKVAIKVLRSGGGDSEDSGGRARMVREAQAIARLAHPNVVAVHDVGPCLDGQVFIAMELVDGGTLSKWLHSQDRTVREIVAVFVQAARGLAAAHAAGLVHRDFKPENVLVGRDGRARVVDFGLVRESDAPPERESLSTVTPNPARLSALSMQLTQVGTVMGTPRYMSPEQKQRKTADARSDQYSFCVALDEALPAARTPPHVRAAIARGLAEQPGERWPGMDALIAELERDPSARRRRWLVAGGAVAGLACAATAVVLGIRAHSSDDPCGGASERIAGVWGPAARTAVEHAFAATNTPYQAAAFQTVTHKLDGYTAAWTHSYEDSCRATHVRHEQSAELLDLRTTCLASRRAELAALVELLQTANAKVVEQSVSATSGLTPVAGCDDLESLQSTVRLPADPAARRAIEEAGNDYAHAKALGLAGRYKDALPELVALEARAKKLAYRPLEAKVVFALAGTRHYTGDVKGGEKTLVDAFDSAIAGRDDDTAAKVAAELVSVNATLAQPARAAEWDAIAAAVIERVGAPPLLQARLASARGHVLATAGKRAEAAAQHELARDLRDKFEPGDLEVGMSYTSLAFDYDEIGRYKDARAAGERALALEQALLGPDHPEIGIVLVNLGNIAVDEGDVAAARAYYLRALALREKTVAAGDDPNGLADVANNLGGMAVDAQQYDEALKYFQRAVELRQRADKDDPEGTIPMIGIATVHALRGECKEAVAQAHVALDIVERKLGRAHPYAGDDLLVIGKCERELGHLESSEQALERSLAIRTTDSRPVELGEAQFELAQTVWLRGNHAHALELANAAHATLADVKATASDLGEVDKWLSSRR
jgi:tetratricopeptide (TPR) repeat protein